MAFSTQKDFFHVPFMNENHEYECNKKACVKMKTYESTNDDRAWSQDKTKQTKFLIDLVTCQFEAVRGHVEDDDSAQVRRTDYGPPAAAARSYGSVSRDDVAGDVNDIAAVELPAGDGLLFHNLDNLTGRDSLLECANNHLAEYQKLLNIKSTLEKQLEVSNEHLKTAKQENKKIKEILDKKLDANTTKDFYNKIQKLIAAGKLSKNEENEMLQIYQKMDNMIRSNEILQGENYYLKRLIEKLSARVTLENIITEPEKSKDIVYLQKEVNHLRKECIMLRQIENNYQKIKKQSSKQTSIGISEQYAEDIKAIIKERNSLREKCQSFKDLEKKVQVLEKQASDASKVTNQLSSNLCNQTDYINKVENEMQNMQKYYENINQDARLREQCLKAQVEDLKGDLIKAKCEAQKAEMLKMEVGCLGNEVRRLNMALSDYDCQYQQLVGVVDELQSVKLQCLQDRPTQTCKDQTEELAFFTSATLDEIMKELKKKEGSNEEFIAAYGLGPQPNDTDAEYNKECCSEMYRLQQEVEDLKNQLEAAGGYEAKYAETLKRLKDMDAEYNKECCSEMYRLQQEVEDLKNQLEAAGDCEAKYAETLKRLKDMVAENMKLQQELDSSKKDIESLNENLKQGEEKMLNMLAKIEKLDKEINKNSVDANEIGKELDNAVELVKQISIIQIENQKMDNALSVINSRDDQKIIDDLRRQLEEELTNLKECQQDNYKLVQEATERNMDIKTLKDIINQLEADKKNLEDERQTLKDEIVNLLNSLKKRETEDGKIKKLYEEDEKNKKDNKDKALVLAEFVNKNTESLKFKLNQGKCFEKEICRLLEDFIQECSFNFCRLAYSKSISRTICHKIQHYGIRNLEFEECEFLHKKILNQAEKLLPGCLLDKILKDNIKKVQSMLSSKITDNLKFSDTNTTDMELKCCSCKTELCCRNSEEMLKDKFDKLEKDFQKLQKCVDIFKTSPLDTGLSSEYDDSNDGDKDNLTFRAPNNIVQRKSSGTKHKKINEACLLKHLEKCRI